MLTNRKNDFKAFAPHSVYEMEVSSVGRSCAAIAFKFKNAFSKNSAGFTLIEVLIVLSIVSIMAVVSIVSLGNGRTERELETNARAVASAIREVQNYALTGRQIVAGTDPCGFRVSWSGATYSTDYMYKNGAVCNRTSSIASYTLKNGVVFITSDVLTFSLPHAALSFSGGSKAAILSKQSTSSVVCVYADGRITDQRGSACP